MSAELLIANTLRIARTDLEGARLLSSHGNRNGIYLLEQAAEKIAPAELLRARATAARGCLGGA